MGTVSVGNASQCVAWHGFHVVYCGPQLGHRSVAHSNIGAHAFVDRLSACTSVYTYIYVYVYTYVSVAPGVYVSCVHISKKSAGHQSGACWLQEVE